jgi:hypothetical protein
MGGGDVAVQCDVLAIVIAANALRYEAQKQRVFAGKLVDEGVGLNHALTVFASRRGETRVEGDGRDAGVGALLVHEDENPLFG